MIMLWWALWLSTVSATLQDCETALQAMVSGFSNLTSEYGDMIRASGLYVNELGRFMQCNSIPHARYAIIQLYRAPTLVFALCGPEICTASDYLSLIHQLPIHTDPSNPINVNKAEVHFPHEYTKDHEQLSVGGGFMVAVIVILATLSLVGTFVEAMTGKLGQEIPESADKKRFIAESFAQIPPEQPSKIKRILLCFSLYSNFLSLFRPARFEPSSHLSCLNAVRVLTICWLVLGHTADVRLLRGVLKNVSDLPDIIGDWKTTPITTAGYAIDTLLWLSGFMLTYTLLSDLKDIQGLKWVEVYLYRVWRVFPLLLFMLFLVWGLFPFLGWGPMWFSYQSFCSDCSSYWWANLLFIHNFFTVDTYHSCYLISYYISLEMQFFLITPPIVYAYRRWGAGFSWLSTAFLTAAALVATFEVANNYDLNAQEISQGNFDYDYYYYYRPYTRAPAYTMGLFCALVVYGWDHRTEGKRDKAATLVGGFLSNSVVAKVSLVVGAGLVTFCVFIQHTALKQGGPNFTYWTEAQNQAFVTFNRWLFTIGVSGIVVPMTLGGLEGLNSVFSWHIWTPLSRITYSVYLTGYNLALVLFLSQQQSWYFSFLNIIQDLLGLLFLTYFLGLIISLLVEIPCVTLAKTFMLTRHPVKVG